MARRATASLKAKEIDEQIKALQLKKAQYIEKANREIGEHLVTSWGVEDIEEAKLAIDALKEQAIQWLIEGNSESKENDNSASGIQPEGNNTNLNNEQNNQNGSDYVRS